MRKIYSIIIYDTINSEVLYMLSELEDLLKQGHVKEVHRILEELVPAKVSRDHALGIANVARRAGFHRLAYKILTPIVRPKNKLSQQKVKPEEICEYGMILYRLGVLNQARKTLSSPEAASCHVHKLYLAFTYFSEWNYSRAKELLEVYITYPGIDQYNRLLGKVNLAQSYLVLGEFTKGIELINEVIPVSRNNNYNLILANAYQNLADLYAHQKENEKAKQYLKELENLIGDAHYRYNLYAKRVLAETQLPDLKLLKEVRLEAKQKCQFELARECDLMEALASRNQALLIKVYFGTPYFDFRKRVLDQWQSPIIIPSNYTWEINPEKPSEIVFDVTAGIIEGTQKKLKRGTSVHRLFRIFAGNMYKSYKIEALFSLLFPDDLLPANLSLYKAYNVIARARIWLEEKSIPITIEETHGEYYLGSEKGCKIRIPLDSMNSKSVVNEHVKQLRLFLVGTDEFAVKDVERVLKISKPSANRVLKEALENGEVERHGTGRSTTYRFVG